MRNFIPAMFAAATLALPPAALAAPLTCQPDVVSATVQHEKSGYSTAAAKQQAVHAWMQEVGDPDYTNFALAADSFIACLENASLSYWQCQAVGRPCAEAKRASLPQRVSAIRR